MKGAIGTLEHVALWHREWVFDTLLDLGFFSRKVKSGFDLPLHVLV